MEMNIEWSIVDLERNSSDGMVLTAHYTVTGKAYEHVFSTYGSVGLTPAKPEDMIPFPDITEEVCVQWVKDALGEDRVQELFNILESQLRLKAYPETSYGTPWGESNAT